MGTVEQPKEQIERKERYRAFVEAQLEQRVIRGRIGELPLMILQSVVDERGVKRGLRAWWDYRRDERGWKTFLDRAEPVMAYPLMINSILRRPGMKPSAGLVMVSFETNWPAEMANVGLRVGNADAASEADRNWLRELLADEEYQVHRRRKLPESVSGGRVIYACDLWIPPALLKHQSLNIPMLPCMAERGDRGRINVLPWWIAVGEDEPRLDAELWWPGALGVSW